MATTQRPQHQPGWAGGCPSDDGPGHAAATPVALPAKIVQHLDRIEA